MRIAGKTTEGFPVISGAFAMSGTHGIPLELILSFFQGRGYVMDWLSYIEDARKDGHKPATIRARILAAVGDVYGPKHAEDVGKRLMIVTGTA